jgi:hypothetical protein
MPYSRSMKTLRHETEMLDRLVSSAGGGGAGLVGIVAGHFMLMPDPLSPGQHLVPMVWQDATSEPVRVQSAAHAGDFPVRSFGYGLQLHCALAQRGAPSRVVILVNDQKWQQASFLPDDIRGCVADAGDARQRFYRQRSPLPPSFTRILEEHGAGEGAFLDNSNPLRSRTDILPKGTFFFSERALRNKFDTYTREEILRDQRFRAEPRPNGGSNLVFRPAGFREEFCLTEDDGQCGCSGEVLQFLAELNEAGVGVLVFFVPEECFSLVMRGVEAGLHYLAQRGDFQLRRVISIGGVGGSGVRATPGEAAPIRVVEQRFA